jgi:hypothetical protein
MTKDEETQVVREVEQITLFMLGAAGVGPGAIMQMATAMLVSYAAITGLTFEQLLAVLGQNTENANKRIAELRGHTEKPCGCALCVHQREQTKEAN